MNDNRLNEKDLDKMLKNSKSGAKIDESGLKSAAQSGHLNDYLSKNLPPDAQKKINSVLSDKEALKKLLSGKEAQELLKKFGKE